MEKQMKELKNFLEEVKGIEHIQHYYNDLKVHPVEIKVLKNVYTAIENNEVVEVRSKGVKNILREMGMELVREQHYHILKY